MLIWSVLSLVFSAPVFAQEPPEDPVSPKAAPRLEIGTDLHAEYLAGERMLVRFEVQNNSTKPAQFADLSARPWLVRFKVTAKNGATQTRYNLPPDVDEGRKWTLAPRARREVLLEIPSSSTFKAGEYSLEIHILDDNGERILPAHPFRIRAALPVGGQIAYEALSTARGGHQVLWVHSALEGADLYLHHADAADPARTLGNYHLLHLSEIVHPILAQAAPQQVWDRHIYWMKSKRSLSYARIRGQTLRAAPATLNFPYPEVELIQRGATDGEGSLHVPFWVPAPSGTGGELRVASVNDRGVPRFRSVIRATTKPGLISTGVDSTGGLRLLLGGSGALDLYSFGADAALPATGKRILLAESGVIAAQIGFLPESEGVPGGMAIGVLQKEAHEDGERFTVAWVAMDGRELMRWPAFTMEAGSSIKDVLISPNTYGLVIQAGSGAHHLLGPDGHLRPIPAAHLGTLVPRLNGGLSIRRFVDGGPIQTSDPQ
jgi:hypothetical protein